MPEPWTCPECGVALASAERLEGHRRQVHGKTPPGVVMRNAALAVGAMLLVAGIAFAVVNRGGDGDGAGGAAAGTRADNLVRFGVDGDPHLGSVDAPVVIVEFGTPRCSACRYFHTNLLPALQAEYLDTGKAVLFYQQFSIGYAFDEPGGVAQECVNREMGNDAFWAFTETLYRLQGQYTADNVDEFLDQFATERGVDPAPVVDCYRTFATVDEYDGDIRAGERVGVAGTPSFYVFGPTGPAQKVGMNQLGAAVEAALAA